MSTVTFKQLCDQLAVDAQRPVSTGSFATLAVAALNRALRWCWTGDDSRFAWPATIASNDSVTVTSSVFEPDDVVTGGSDWYSFWRSDPRVAQTQAPPYLVYPPYAPSVPPVPVKWDGTQFNIQDPSITGDIFAFYRLPLPQGTSVTDEATEVPDFFFDPATNYALADYFRAERLEQLMLDARREAVQWFDSSKAAIINSDASHPWDGNIITP